MSHYCYILFSPALNRYYVGETENIDLRIKQHNEGYFKRSYTRLAKDWELFLLIYCKDRSQARFMEKFIKRMKSKTFIVRLRDEKSHIDGIMKKFS